MVPLLQECNVEISFICAQVTSPRISFCKYTSNHLLHIEEDRSKEFAAENVSVISIGLCKEIRAAFIVVFFFLLIKIQLLRRFSCTALIQIAVEL